MFKAIITTMLLATLSIANTNLLYSVSKGSKTLGLYEIGYNTKNKGIKTRAYGVTSKIKFFVNKKINYVEDGYKVIEFTKNKKHTKFDVKTKKSILSAKILKKYDRKLKKVKHDDMLLLTQQGKRGIKLFNKRKTTLVTLEEILKSIVNKDLKDQNIIFFEKSGVMKMIAKIVTTKDGFDIVNKSKDTKYLKIVVKNDLPVEVKSYVSDWTMRLYGEGDFKKYSVGIDEIKANLSTFVKSQFSNNNQISFIKSDKLTIKKKKYIYSYRAKISYPSDLNDNNKKRYCVKTYKKYAKKGKNISYGENECSVTLTQKILAKKINRSIIDGLKEKHPQLRQTKKFKISKKGTIMYKVIDIVR